MRIDWLFGIIVLKPDDEGNQFYKRRIWRRMALYAFIVVVVAILYYAKK